MEEKQISEIYKALSDETRLKIIKDLIESKKETCACEFLKLCSCKQATLSHHLSILNDCGLLSFRREGKRILYSLNEDVLNKVLNYLKGD